MDMKAVVPVQEERMDPEESRYPLTPKSESLISPWNEEAERSRLWCLEGCWRV